MAIVSHCCAEYISGNNKKIIAFSIIVNIKRAHLVEILPLGRQEWVHLLSQYHYCWCPGDGRIHGMSSHGVDVVLLNISDLAPLGFINDSYRMTVGQQYNKMADDNISQTVMHFQRQNIEQTLTSLQNSSQVSLLQTLIILILAWINNLIYYKLWDEITYPFPNFNGETVGVWKWINNFILPFIGHEIAYPC